MAGISWRPICDAQFDNELLFEWQEYHYNDENRLRFMWSPGGTGIHSM